MFFLFNSLWVFNIVVKQHDIIWIPLKLLHTMFYILSHMSIGYLNLRQVSNVEDGKYKVFLYILK